MSLTPGTRLGPYEILAALGGGGMSACGRESARLRQGSGEVPPKLTPSPCR